jgi:hypothetical protein
MNAPLGEHPVNAPPGLLLVQQLPVPVLALPPFGALHFAALLLMLHLVLPLLVVRQHLTLFVPQVDFDAHFCALPRQPFGSSASEVFAHWTYAPFPPTVGQPQSAAMSFSAASRSPALHPAVALEGRSSAPIARTAKASTAILNVVLSM